jgi:hypothetical protein
VESNWVHSALRPPIGLLCQPRVIMMMEKLVEWWLAGESEVLGENVPHCRFLHHKPHMLCPHANPGRAPYISLSFQPKPTQLSRHSCALSARRHAVPSQNHELSHLQATAEETEWRGNSTEMSSIETVHEVSSHYRLTGIGWKLSRCGPSTQQTSVNITAQSRSKF